MFKGQASGSHSDRYLILKKKMKNDDMQNNNWITISDGFKNLSNLVYKTIEIISIDNGTVKENLERMSKNLKEALRPLFDLYNSSMFENIGKRFKMFSDEVLLMRLQSLGSFEWCNLDETIDMSKYAKDDNEKDNPISIKVMQHFQKKSEYTVLDVDRYIGKFFTKDVVRKLETDTIDLLDEKDSEKLKRAMIDYRARRYLGSASILASLIDAQSIKQELFDVHNGKYHPENLDNNNSPKISQGWRAFYYVFKNNFSKYFNNEAFDGSAKKEKREKKFDEFLENIKGEIPNDKTMIAVISLSICLLNFFDDSIWLNYPNNKPQVINRHWLMHGMYDIEDITRYDCLKLLLMLNQISILYDKLKKEEM